MQQAVYAEGIRQYGLARRRYKPYQCLARPPAGGPGKETSMGVRELMPARQLRAVFGVSRLAEIAGIVPGVALAAGIMLAALPLADLAGRALLSAQGIDPAGKASPVSGVLVAILIGIFGRQ